MVLPGAADDENKDDVLVGVVSFAPEPCGWHSSVSAKVYYYLDWIEEAKNSLKPPQRNNDYCYRQKKKV